MNKKGVTLIELLVVMAILGIVLAMIYKSYIVVLKSQVQQSGIAQSNINNLIGLEMLRKDIEMAGFGLPWYVNTSSSEAVHDTKYKPDPCDLNTNSSRPAAFSFSNNGNTDANNSDVLVIRSSVAALNNYTEHWGYVYEDLDNTVHYRALGGDNNINGIHFAVIKPYNMEFFKYVTSDDFGGSCKPGGNIFLLFGISNNEPSFPYNRVDYYLRKSNTMPSRCAPGTYELYRATINQSDGKRNEQPILDCVVNFQVKFGLDNNSDGTIDSWSDAPYSSGTNSQDVSKKIREQLRQVKVLIVYQEGKKDPEFTFNNSFNQDNQTDNSTLFTPSGEQKHYRWKKVEFIVEPLNIRIRMRNLEQ